MLGVSNRTTWENYFKQPTIYNCDVKVYDENNNLLCDKKNIISFRFKARNDYVGSSLPTKDCSIEIINWSSLSNTIKTYLSTVGNIVKVRYVVQSTETTDYEIFKVKNVTIDRKEINATVELASLFNFMTRKTGKQEYGILDTEYHLLQNMKSFPLNVSNAVKWQEFALFQCKGLYIKQDATIDYKDFDVTTVNGSYSGENIIDDYEYKYDDDKSGLRVFGIETGTEIELASKTVTSSGQGADKSLNKLWEYESVVTRITTSNTSMSINYVTVNGVYVELLLYSVPAVIKVYGYQAELTEIPNDVDYYISTYTVETGSDEANAIQTYARGYYANRKMIDFDCRIDPTIQPLDIVNIDLEEGIERVAIEEVSINFNGGFTGHIRGRVCGTELKKPIIKNLDIPHGTFKIQNTNAVNVVCTIYYSGGSIILNINANSTLPCDIDDNVSQLEMSFSSKSMSELYDDVYCGFTATDYFDSENVIILESDS